MDIKHVNRTQYTNDDDDDGNAYPALTPNKIYLRYTFSVSVCRYICSEEWPSQVHNYYYTLALLALQFVIPLAVLIFTYTRIAIAVWGKRPPGEAENSRDQRMARSKRKVSGIGAFKPHQNLVYIVIL